MEQKENKKQSNNSRIGNTIKIDILFPLTLLVIIAGIVVICYVLSIIGNFVWTYAKIGLQFLIDHWLIILGVWIFIIISHLVIGHFFERKK